MKTNLATIEDLKKFSTISANVDVELLEPFLNIAQEMYVAPVLGDALYSDLVTQVENCTATGITQTLIDEYIIPAIAYSAWYSASPFLAYKTQRTGLQKTQTDTLVPIEVSEMSIYMTKLENLKAFYLNRLEHYLVENETSFPLFKRNCVQQSNGGSVYLGWLTKQRRNDYWDADGGDTSILTDNECCD